MPALPSPSAIGRQRRSVWASIGASCLLLMAWAVTLPGSSAPAAYAGDNLWTWAGVSGTVMQVVTDPLHPGTVYARVGSSWQSTTQIMKSTDGGATWTNIAAPGWAQIRKIAMAFSAPHVLYAATDSGVYRTDDGGSTWRQVHKDPRVQAVAVSPVDWRETYVATTLVVGFTQTNVISKSIDGGQTWADSSAGLPANPPVDDLVIAPSAPHILIARPFNMANGPLYKSTDAGQSWAPIGSDAMVGTNTVAFDPTNSNIIYLGTFSPGGWKSINGGGTWQPMANGLQQNGVGFSVNPDNAQVLHAANLTAGVIESLDGGLSWSPLNTGIQGLEVRSIAIASRQPLVIYAGLTNAGIWKLTRTAIQDYSVTINDAALFTSQTQVTLTLTAPPGTTQIQISNDGGFGGADWEPFAPTRPWTISASGSAVIPRTVYVKFRTAGQISGLYQDEIILDTTPPSGSIELREQRDSGAAPFRASAGRPRAGPNTLHLPLIVVPRAIEVVIAPTDDVSGVGAMQVSGRADFADAAWEPFAPVSRRFVTSSGPGTIYVRLRDRAGNQSAVFTATISP